MATGRPKKVNKSSSSAGGTKKTSNRTSRTKASSSKTRSRSGKSKAARQNQLRDEVMVLFSFACAFILILSNFHMAGVVGEKIKWFMFGLFGVMEYIFPIIIAGSLIFLVSNKNLMGVARIKTAAVYALTIFLSAAWQRVYNKPEISTSSIGKFFTYSSEKYKGGGFFGGVICKILSPLGFWGSMVILLILIILCIILITEKSFISGIVSMRQNGKKMMHAAKQDYDIYREHSSERLSSDKNGPAPEETEEEYLKRRRAEKEARLSQREAKREQQLKARQEQKEKKQARMQNKALGVTLDTELPRENPVADSIDLDEIQVDTSRNDQYSSDIYDPEEAGMQHTGFDALDSFESGIQQESTITQEVPFDLSQDHMSDTATDTIHEAALRFNQIESGAIKEDQNQTNPYDQQFQSAGMTNGSSDGEELDQTGYEHLESEPDEFAHAGQPEHYSYDSAQQDEEAEPNDATVTHYDYDSDLGNDSENADPAGYQDASQNADQSANIVPMTSQATNVASNVASNLASGVNPNAAAGGAVAAAATAMADASAAEQQAQPEKPKVYEFPPIELLKKNTNAHSGNQERENKTTAMRLQQTLQNFGVKVTITDISCGPAVTRYELQPELGVKVSKIVSLSDDIKLNLAAADIRIEAPIPGKAAIGIEVPNKEAGSVMLRELLETDTFKNHPSPVAFAAGKDIAGKTIVADIAKMPHLLIAGATGSGKSVCINTIIMSVLYKAKPEDVKLIMIDPKVVELSVYNGIPHLMIPVVTDPKKASSALNWAVAEMTDRYKKFAKMNVRDLKGYNAKIAKMQIPEGMERPKKLCQLIIIIDELADLMMVAPGEVEDAICRLAQLARAAGIHLVIATQRPSVNVITGLIKANVPSRIAFSVSSGVDSRTIIDMNGAEKLLGKGDMLFFPSGYPKPVRVQGAFVSDEEVGRVVDFLKANSDEEAYNEEVNNAITSVQSVAVKEQADDRDAYFAEAGRFIIEKEKGSIGMLQRYYKIGFNRAARIMDQLADAHVVGPEVGTKPRKVLMTLDEFEEFLKQDY